MNWQSLSHGAALADSTVRSVESDHVHLRQRLQQLGERVLHEWPPAWRTELWALTQELEQHFAHEEDGGFLAVVVEAAPQRSDEVQALLAQHEQFRQTLRELRRLCAGGHSPGFGWGLLAVKFAHFQRRFEEHERAEHELLQEALGRDHGAGD